MAGLGAFVLQKLYRAGEAAHLLLVHAADMSTRRALIDIYASLSKPERYNDEVRLNLRIRGTTFPFRMRLSDIFIIGEILHERQYRLKSRIPRNAMIVDAGGNVGISAIWFMAQHPDATMHVFEPAMSNFHYLESNTSSLKGVGIFQAAIGKQKDTLTLFHGEFAGMHSLVDAALDDNSRSETVPVVALADHMEQHEIEKIDLLKLDIEGSELEAMLGLRERIKDVNVIVGEVHEALVDEREFYGFLKQHGFSILWRRRFREGREQRVHGFEAVRSRE